MKKSYAVVTGASSGIGACFARLLAAEGYSLVLVARRRERLEKLAQELEQKGTSVVIETADLSQKSECLRLMAALGNKPVGVFINNAGFGDCGRFTETSLDKELGMIEVNVRAVHILTKLVLRRMKRQGSGYLLNVASSAGLIPAGPYMAAYYATKAYVTSLTRAVARELKEEKSNVYLGVLCPGPVDTEFHSVANVEFALPGISPEYCAEYALSQMKRRRVVIVPTIKMKAATSLVRLLPQSVSIVIAGHQQKKKLARH